MAPRAYFELPEPLIQHVHSFLTTKQAARTSILSKSWLSAWHTRPNLDFDHNDFFPDSDRRPNIDDDDVTDSLSKFANKTIRRYEISNLTIESFSLLNIQMYCTSQSARYTNLIVRTLILGATRLTVRLNCYLFRLPNEVFASQNLVALTANICKINKGLNPTVGCSSLRSLTFNQVKIENSDVLFRVLSSCPLIEKLSLIHILNFGDGGVGTGGGDMIALPRLTSLVLDHAVFDTLFLNALSSKFPSLKDLTLGMRIVEAQEEMLISSPSLERLDFNIERYLGGSDKFQRVKFDLPRIGKLTVEGSIASCSSTRSSSKKWESDVSVTHHHHHLTARSIDFLGVTLLQGLQVRISNLRQLMYDGLNDLKEARAQIFYKPASMWRDVPILDDSSIPKDYQQDFRFQLIWQPKQIKN